MFNPIFHWAWHPSWYLWPIYLGNYSRFIYLSDFVSQNGGVLEHLRSSLFTPPIFVSLGHFWSLCVEEQFYLAWPFVVFFVKDRIRLRNLCLAVFLITPFLRLLCVYTLPAAMLDNEFLYRFTPLRIDALLLGGFIALCLRGPETERIVRLAKPVVLSILGLFVFIEAGLPLFTHAIGRPDANVRPSPTVERALRPARHDAVVAGHPAQGPLRRRVVEDEVVPGRAGRACYGCWRQA